jgi:hypothetical protein
VPGPSIGFLEEALRWWGHWLMGIDTGIMDEPMLRAWMQEYTPPAPRHAYWPGRWVAEPCWPPAGAAARRLFLRADGVLSGDPGDGAERVHRGEQVAGLDAGALTADGGFGDWPGGQRAEDGRLAPFGPPEWPPGIATEVLSRRPTQRTIRHNLTDGSAEVIFDWDVGGNFRLVDAGIEADGFNLTSYRIVGGDPLSAEVRTGQAASLRSARHDVAVEATGHMTAVPSAFHVTLGLDARENGHRVHSRQWHLEFPRNGA